jgi:2-aminoadipate transaminase
MSRDRREALCAVAATHGIPVIEDAPYRRLTFGGEPEPAVRTLGALSGARVIFVGSFAKTVAPGLRAGYVLAEPALIDSLTLLKQGEDFCSPGVSQIVIERLIRNGTLARQESTLAKVHGAKRDAMLAALEEEMRGLPVHWTRPSGGLFLWLTLPEGADADRILERAIERQIAFIPGRHFYPDEETGADGRPRLVEPPGHTLRLNFSYPPLDQIRRGITVLAGVLREML